MAEILVDGIADLVAVEEEKTVADIVAGVRRWAAQQHRIVTGVRLDGGEVLAPDEAGLSSRGLAEIGRIEITTESLFVAIATMLAAVYGEIPGLLSRLQEHAVLLRKKPDADTLAAALKTIERCAESHRMLVKAMAAVSAGGGERTPFAAAIAQQVVKMRDTLQQCSGAMERRDYVLLADCCEYELVELMSALRSEAERVYARVRKASRNAPSDSCQA